MCQSPFFPALSFVWACGFGARVGIVGSRDFRRSGLVRSFVAGLPPGCVVVSGASGAVDLAAAAAAREFGLGLQEFPADWERFGRAAGPLRNQELVSSGLCCLVVFLSSVSRPSLGSLSALRLARRAGVRVFVFGPDGRFISKFNRSISTLRKSFTRLFPMSFLHYFKHSFPEIFCHISIIKSITVQNWCFV